MKCPYCGNLGDKVVDSRESKEGEVIRRRRECLECVEHAARLEGSGVLKQLELERDPRSAWQERRNWDEGRADQAAADDPPSREDVLTSDEIHGWWRGGWDENRLSEGRFPHSLRSRGAVAKW